MSVYKPKNSAVYQFDFQFRRVRFSGSTGQTSRREAEAVEKDQKEKAKAALKAQESVAGGPLTMGVAAQRYWTEVGQHHSGAETTLTNLNRLCNYFGNAMRLDQISDDDVAKLVAWRRAQTVRGRKLVRDPQNPKRRIAPPTIAAATVNRSTIEPLQKLFNRAARVWRIPLKNEPDWRKHLLKEPTERVREVRAAEEGAVREAVRRDFLPLVCFARAAGLRLSECLLRKDSVDLAGGRIRTIGKGGKLIDHPITFEMRAILMSEMANPTDYVFTYAAARAKPGKEGHARGARKPITAAGLKTMWRRAKNRGGGPSIPADLRFHDLRHDFATKLLRETKNLKLVQKALHHSKIETTTKYAHVLDEEVLAGMEAASRRRLGTSET